jgi:hypothetical protein
MLVVCVRGQYGILLCTMLDQLYLYAIKSGGLGEKLSEEFGVQVEQVEVAAVAFIEIAAKQR